ncbi:MAG: Gldg family protein [Wenzhouxiangellaceae bacterium]|nr:Gldg family protein [Wenzhouxiangellaceae bacterium]
MNTSKFNSVGALVLLAVLFVALTMLSSVLLRGWRLDLTENRLYTLSEGTVNIVRSLPEPVTLKLFFSEAASADLPQIRQYATRVWELMREMAARSDGNLRLERIDPEPFSEAEDEAARYGLEAVPRGVGGETLYFGIVGTNTIDGLEVLPFLAPNREASLEYELARMVDLLSRAERPRVGLLSGLPLSGGFNMQTGQRNPAWTIYEQWQQLFDVETVAPSATALPEDLDALIVVHPKELSDELLFSIDQFVLGGGRLLAFVDPWSEADRGNPGDPMSRFTVERSSTLEPLFTSWGLDYDAARFVADVGRALQVTLQPGQPPVRHPAILGLGADEISSDDIVTADLGIVNLGSAGALARAEDSSLTLEPLLTSSDYAGLLDVERLRALADPVGLAVEVGRDGGPFVLAARLSGTVESAFPDRLGEDDRTSGMLSAIVIADTDLLTDSLWVQRQNFLGQVLLNPFADNGALAVNAVENLLGNADLISIRSRETSQRPFTLVEQLRREAEDRLRATEQQLEAELSEAENRLTELQQRRGDADLSVLTPEQEAEIDRFVERRLEIRRQLRQVRRQLDQEIEALGARVKLINIALIPLLLTVAALLVALRRRKARRAGGHE